MDKQQNKSYYHAVQPSRDNFEPCTIVGSITDGNLNEVERLVELGYSVAIRKIESE
ncbi:MAG: hypothetical protein GY853_15925 [PVC group bacterium]|nr:hypothetical protein [PVC group bacterium]